MIEMTLFFMGAVITSLAGIPLALRLARTHTWRGYAHRDARPDFHEVLSRVAFAPLDLGPDLMKWPSEIPRPSAGPTDPPWPSQTWDDPHFGARWKSAEGRARAAADLVNHGASPALAVAPTPARPRRRSTPAPSPTAARPQPRPAAQPKPPSPQRAKPQRPRTPQPEHRERVVTPPPQRRAPAQRKAAPAPAPQGAPAREELEHLVDTLGLAGTVKQIMQRTGWDFRKAAQYLAQARQGR